MAEQLQTGSESEGDVVVLPTFSSDGRQQGLQPPF